MEWFKFYVRDLTDRLLLITDDAAIGAWIRLLAKCYELENGGCFERCGGYSTRQWLVVAGVDCEAVDRVVAAGLATREGDALRVQGYDLEGEQKATNRSRQNRELALRRWGNAKGSTEGNAKGSTEGNAEGEGEGEQKEKVCAELSRTTPAAPPEPALLVFPCAGKVKVWTLTESIRCELAQAFPAVDVLACARRALEWVRANPTKAKTAKRMRSWLGSVWCAGDQDRGGRPARDLSRGHFAASGEAPVRTGLVIGRPRSAPLAIVPKTAGDATKYCADAAADVSGLVDGLAATKGAG